MITLSTGHIAKVRKAWIGSVTTRQEDSGQTVTFVHTKHRVEFFASQADADSGKPLHLHDFETQFVGPHADPGGWLKEILERHCLPEKIQRHGWRSEGFFPDQQVALPDVHGILAHPSMAALQPE
jgi:hypothetical protein